MRSGKNNRETWYELYFYNQVSLALTTVFQQNSSLFWKGADIINQQKALLAVQNLQKKYCTRETPSIFSSGEPTASTSSSKPRKPAETTSTPLTLSKTPHQIEPQNPPCEILCLPGTTENNIKASKLQLFIESEFNFYMTKVSF